jgi:hypothetical protein
MIEVESNRVELAVDAWGRISGLSGHVLTTEGRNHQFTVDVVRGRYLVVIPEGRDPQVIPRREIEEAAALVNEKEELTLQRLRREFPKVRHLSYILAILKESH